jgi:predicted 3-demethylubiquinone-9 3-methyltransferase (glyoxalase superfamily)
MDDDGPLMDKITPFLWFDGNAEAAMNLYVSIFDDAKILSVSRYGEEGPGSEGSVMTASFELFGQRFVALNGGPQYAFTPAISFLVNCETQQEVDRYWDQLSEGGQTMQCGWLTDKFGVTWQIVPSILPDLLGDEDDEKSSSVMRAMLRMEKLDIATLQRAYDLV